MHKRPDSFFSISYGRNVSSIFMAGYFAFLFHPVQVKVRPISGHSNDLLVVEKQVVWGNPSQVGQPIGLVTIKF